MQELKPETIAGNAHLFTNLQLTMSRKSKSVRPENNYRKGEYLCNIFQAKSIRIRGGYYNANNSGISVMGTN